jgi:hypothetical protein
MKPSRCWSLGLAWLAVWLAGCGGNSDESYVPQSESAKEALQMALDAWKAGQPADPVGALPSGATIRAIDMDWAAGSRLAAYEIVQELPQSAEPGPRRFTVKLTLDGSAQPVEVTYLVVGIDPLQVFRDKDYDLYFGAPADAVAARAALTKALDCWRLRITPEELLKAEPAITFTDPDWQAGHRLVEFQLEPGEQAAGASIHWQVKLRIAAAGGAEQWLDAKYAVSTDPNIQISRQP